MSSAKPLSQRRAWIVSRRMLTLGFASLVAIGGFAVSATSVPIISTVAGGGAGPGNGDLGPAVNAVLTNPVDVAIDASGNLYISDIPVYVGQDGFKVRRVDAAGIITTVAGNGSSTYNGDGISATSAGIDTAGIAVDGAGNLFIADRGNHRIRKVGPNGVISTVAGNGASGFAGDGGQARNAKLYLPSDVAVDSAGNLFILDRFNERVRRVGVDRIIRTVAGNGQYGFSGDGGAATAASFADPQGIAIDRSGNLFIADYGNDRIRRVTPAGTISTIAGGGPFRSDPVATSMKLLHPHGVAVDARGNVYIAEMNNLVRVVSPDGIIKVVVGQYNDTTFGNEGAPWGFAGDGGPADQALIYDPLNLALDKNDNLFIADSRNGRVRKVTTVPTSVTPAGLNAFDPYRSYPAGSFTLHVAIADVTGDGREDALLTTGTWGGPYAEPANDFKVLLFVQKADGTLAPPLRYGFSGDPAGRSGSGLATGDLDRDGFMDVVVGTLDGVAIFRGNPGGLSSGVVSAGVTDAEAVTSVALLDVDRDGNLDIATLGCCRSEGGTSFEDKYGMTVHYGDGHGAISRKVFFASATGAEVGGNLKAFDVNRDGLPDLTRTWNGQQTGGVELLLHSPGDGFNPPVRLGPSTPGWVGAAYAIGDFNDDGLNDFMLSREGNAPDAKYIYLRQDARGLFPQLREWSAYDSPQELISADMNNDGMDDLLVVHGGWSSIGYHEQTWQGLGPEIKYYTVQSGNPSSPAIAVGDLNGDHCKDIAMADYNYGLVVMNGKHCLTIMHDSPAPVPHPPSSWVTAPGLPATPSSAPPTGRSNGDSEGVDGLLRMARSAPQSLLRTWRAFGPAAMPGWASFGLLIALGWLAWLRFYKPR